jgi:hypothetical protein
MRQLELQPANTGEASQSGLESFMDGWRRRAERVALRCPHWHSAAVGTTCRSGLPRFASA